MNRKLTKNFNKRVFIIALPIMFQQLITAFASLVDNLMVGSLGEPAIAGVGAANMIFSVVLFIGFGISEGCSIFTAQQYGAKQFEQMKYTFVTSIYYTMLLSVVSMLFVWFFADFLIGLYINGNDQVAMEAMEYGVNYIKIALFSYGFIILNVAIGSSYRATGKTKIPMYAGVVAILLNTFLNYCLIYGNFGLPQLGVSGAAIATIISRIVELCILVSVMFISKVEFLPTIRNFIEVPLKLFKSITLKVIPLTINEFGWAMGRATMMGLYGAKSASEFAAVQMSNTVSGLLFVTMSGFSVAVSVFIGQELGRGNLEEAKNDGFKLLKLGLITGIVMTFVAFVLAWFMPLIYGTVSPETMKLSQQILVITGLFFPVYIVTAAVFFILRAGGDTKSVLIMDSLFMWVVAVPFTFALVSYTDLHIVYIYALVNMTEVLKMLVCFKLFGNYHWLKKIV